MISWLLFVYFLSQIKQITFFFNSQNKVQCLMIIIFKQTLRRFAWNRKQTFHGKWGDKNIKRSSYRWSWVSLSIPKASSNGETFLHTYKVTIGPFHNEYRITPTFSASHGALGRKHWHMFSLLLDCWVEMLINLGSNTTY